MGHKLITHDEKIEERYNLIKVFSLTAFYRYSACFTLTYFFLLTQKSISGKTFIFQGWAKRSSADKIEKR
jgi:hypothetical protein